uniref:Polycomb complex protein BMI-1 n=1 Tax=Cacopsylla melanoneura TaxID=428564 RepID=A0A8D8WU77_9HEMI
MISTSKKLKVTDLNPFLICVLCKGYYIDATTIVECLHSFCKTCIVKYLQKHKYCPICDVLVYKTKPLQNIRPDKRLQNVVYKLIPGLYEREMQRRQLFFSSSPVENAQGLSGEDRGVITESSDIILPDENISITLEYLAHSMDDMNKAIYGRRYLRCKASAPLSILHKFLKTKYNLSNKQCVELVCNNELLTSPMSVMDVAYIYQWKKKTPMYLGYRILETTLKRISEKQEAQSCKRLKLAEEISSSQGNGNEKKPIPVENGACSRSEPMSTVSDPLTNEVPHLGVHNYINSKPVPSSKSQDNVNPAEWKEVELKINDNGEMSATVLPPVTSSSQSTKQPYSTPSVTLITSIAYNTSLANTMPSPSTISTSYESKPLASVPTVTSHGTVGNRALVYPIIHESKASTQMTFSNPNMKIPVTSPGVYMPRGSRPRPPSVPRYKTLKTGVQPWNPTVSRSKVSVGTSDPLKPQDNVSKIFKSRNARFMNSPSPPTPTAMPMPKVSQQDILKPRVSSNSSVTKVDPRTLSPIVPASSSTTSKVDSPTYISTPSPPSHLSRDKLNKFVRPPTIKDFNPFLHPSLFYPGFLPYPPDSNPLLPNSHPVDNNPLLPNSHPDFMKAMSALYQQHNPAFHSSLPPSISTLFNFRLPSPSEKKSSPSSSSPRASSQSGVGSRSTPSHSSCEVPRSTASNHIYSLSNLPSSISVSPTSLSNSHHLPASMKSYIPLNSISNSTKVTAVKSFSPVKSSPSVKEKSPTTIFSPAQMFANANCSSTSSKCYSSSSLSSPVSSSPSIYSSSSSQPLSLVTTTSSVTRDVKDNLTKDNPYPTVQKGTTAMPSSNKSDINTSSSKSNSNTIKTSTSNSVITTSVSSSVLSSRSESISTTSSTTNSQKSVEICVGEVKKEHSEIKSSDKVPAKNLNENNCDLNEGTKDSIMTNGENNNHLKTPSITN